jgi:general secretion pathway protein G
MPKRGRKWLVAALAIIALLIGISIPVYKTMILSSREKTLKTNLLALRDVIDQYTADKKKAPQTLQDLVDARYFRELPMDPLTHSNSTWEPVIDVVVISPGKTDRGIVDVHSGSSSISSDKTAYRAW